MRNISEFSDDLLVKILLLTPMQDVMATSLLSKRWRYVWKLVPKLEYDDSYNATASQFIDTHETLVVLRLKQALIEDVPSSAFFRCLKTLSLIDVIFSSDKTVDRFLSCCPILETLDVDLWIREEVKTFAICVPSLQRLKIKNIVGGYKNAREGHGFVINAPSLIYLKIIDHLSGFFSLVKMPEKVEANIHLRHCDSEELLGSLTSAKKISLCLKPKMDSYHPECDFDQLVSLELCVMCSLDWLNLLLRHSPKLRFLRFKIFVSFEDSRCRNSKSVRSKWEQPSCIPECLMLSLETVEWVGYKGTQEEKCVLMYLLENGSFLKKMSVKFSLSTEVKEKIPMQMEIESMPRSSSKCRLSFT
ncbi:putative FBD-associated F-box protein At5g56430 [Eutrema salsugineum]|uniref:putative FBD-associated F-box protein At5g56430 n=1 Tax=Eutrema salsugineum TaxID=72664 RepID=UPI000CED53E6|nr:putative FBD-associated F-box protein At5g56430 [Eutrema salsugineum]